MLIYLIYIDIKYLNKSFRFTLQFTKHFIEQCHKYSKFNKKNMSYTAIISYGRYLTNTSKQEREAVIELMSSEST